MWLLCPMSYSGLFGADGWMDGEPHHKSDFHISFGIWKGKMASSINVRGNNGSIFQSNVSTSRWMYSWMYCNRTVEVHLIQCTYIAAITLFKMDKQGTKYDCNVISFTNSLQAELGRRLSCGYACDSCQCPLKYAAYPCFK